MIKALLKVLKGLVLVAIIMMIQACGVQSNSKISINYVAGEKLNPDINNRPSPLVVTIYHLKSLRTFDDADFFELYHNAQSILGAELVFQDYVELKPNQTMTISQIIQPETKYLAFVAAYRDLNNSDWQSIIPIDSIKKNLITVLLKSDALQLKS